MSLNIQKLKIKIIIDEDMVSFRDNGIGFDINSKGTGLGLKILKIYQRCSI